MALVTAEQVSNIAENEESASQQNVIDKVTSLPLVSSACDQVSTAYTSTKESDPSEKTVCAVPKQGMKTIPASGAKPIIDQLEPQISSEHACRGLEKLPILHQATDEVLSETGGGVTLKLTDGKDTAIGVVETATTAVQDHLERTKAVVVEGASAVGQLVATSMGISLLKSEELVDCYLPMTKEELAKVAAPTEGSDTETVQEQSYYVRLGSLSSKVRSRAYQYSIVKMQQSKQNGQEALSRLCNLVDLIEMAKTGAASTPLKGQDVQASLNQTLLDWRKQQPDGQSEEELSEKPEQLESQSLAITRNFSDQLQTICWTLASNVNGLPQNIEDEVQHMCKLAEEICSSLSAASSFQDLSTQFLARSKEQMLKICEAMDGVMDYVIHNTPLNWLVGPFLPQLTEDLEPQMSMEVKQPRIDALQ